MSGEPKIRTFVGYRPKVPEHYIEGGYGNDPEEAQFQGVEFDDGTVAVRWLTQFRSTSVWPNFAEFEAVHGHADYETKIAWSPAGQGVPDERRLQEALDDVEYWKRQTAEAEAARDALAANFNAEVDKARDAFTALMEEEVAKVKTAEATDGH